MIQKPANLIYGSYMRKKARSVSTLFLISMLLGLQLIQDLVSQLNGTLKLDQNNGTSYTIIFE